MSAVAAQNVKSRPKRRAFLPARVSVVIGTLVYIVAMHLTYVYLLTEQYAYLGFLYKPSSPTNMGIVWVMAMVPCFTIPIKLERPSVCAYWIIYILAFVPSCIIPMYMGLTPPDEVFVWSSVLLACVLSVKIIYRFPLLKFTPPRIPTLLYWIFIGTMTVLFYTVIFATFGISLNLANFKDVYGVRGAYKDTLKEVGTLPSYALEWQGNTVNLLYLAVGIGYGRLIPLALGLVGQLLLYAIVGYKSVLLSALLVGALVYAMRVGNDRFGSTIVWGLLGIQAISALLYVGIGWQELVVSIVRRMQIMPGVLSGLYYDYFSKHSFGMLADTLFLRYFVESPYSRPLPEVIGMHYFHHPSNANVHLWGYGYASLGYPGMLLFTLLLWGVLWVYDSVAQGRDPKITIIMIGIPAFTLANTSLLTSLLHHGVALAILLVALLPKTPEAQKPTEEKQSAEDSPPASPEPVPE